MVVEKESKMRTHSLKIKNDSNHIKHFVKDGSLPYVRLSPGNEIEITVNEDNILYKYNSVRIDKTGQHHYKKNPNFTAPKNTKHQLVTHIKNNKTSDHMVEILHTEDGKIRLHPGMEAYLVFDKLLDAEKNEIVYKEIIINEPVEREVDAGRGLTRIDKLQSIDYIKHDADTLEDLQAVRSAKLRKKLGLE